MFKIFRVQLLITSRNDSVLNLYIEWIILDKYWNNEK